jgi:hypothetical protein
MAVTGTEARHQLLNAHDPQVEARRNNLKLAAAKRRRKLAEKKFLAAAPIFDSTTHSPAESSPLLNY